MAFADRFLNAVERTGNRLPDPVFIFVWLIGLVFAASVLAASLGMTAINPASGETITAQSLLASDNLRKLFVDMPKTLTGFAPLGYVLVVMLGAGVAERSGFFASLMRVSISRAPKAILTPLVILVAIVANHAADAAYVVLVPLAGVIYAAAGRHPIVGIAAAFAGVSGGFSANIFPGHLDALLLGITEPAAQLIDPTWRANIAGNWWFIVAMTVLFVPIGWWVTDRVIEPRLGTWRGAAEAEAQPALGAEARRGLLYAGVAAALVVAAWAAMTLMPNAPFIDAAAEPALRLDPFYKALVSGFFVLFLATGWAYGVGAGTVRSHRDLVQMMSQTMADMGSYIVLAFMAAHFVALFNWSNLGAILAIHGAEGLRASGLPYPFLLMGIVLLSAAINLVVGSASAKWAALAPVLVPMLMLLGISPEMSTAAYRMGDSVTNIVTPLMVYFPLVLTFCRRWDAEFGMGSLMATMLPFSLAFLLTGVLMTGAWIAFDWPLGPGAGVHYELRVEQGRP